MAKNIIAFPSDPDWFADLREFEGELQKIKGRNSYEQYTAETGHLLYLCAGIADNRDLPSEVRKEACRLLWVYAPVRQVLERNMDCDWVKADFAHEADSNWRKVSMK